MNISSRTPEGSPGRCSLCGKEVRMEPSWPTLDATCPYCGNLVWMRVRKQSRVTRVRASVPLPAILVASLFTLGLICVNWWLLESWQERAFVNLVALFLVVMLLFGRWIGSIGLPHATYLFGRLIGRRLNLLVLVGDLAISHSRSPKPLATTEVVQGAVKSGFIGLVLAVLGLVAIGSIGAIGSMSGPGIVADPSTGGRILAVAIGFGCVVLMLPSALLLGIGIQHLRLSLVGICSLIVGKPVYGFTVVVDFRRKAY